MNDAAGEGHSPKSGEMTSLESNQFYSRRADWQHSVSSVNISIFVFNDCSGSGIFETCDRPMAGVVVALVENDTVISSVRTNANGWANFSASAHDGDAVIRSPGVRQLLVVCPPHWRITSGQAYQDIDLKELKGSIGGISLLEAPKSVGLSPVPSVSGTIDEKTSSVTVKMNGQSGLHFRGQGIGGQDFFVPASIGSIILQWDGGTRELAVAGLPIHVGTIGGEIGIPKRFKSETINFESVTRLDIGKIPNGYAGLAWNNFVAVRSTIYRGEGYVNCAVGGAYVAYNGSGLPCELSCDSKFDFIACNVGAAWLNSEGEELIVEAFREERLVQRDVVPLSALGPVSYEPNLSQVSRVRFSTAHHWQFVLGNLTISRH